MGGRSRGFRACNSVEARAALGQGPLIRRRRGHPGRPCCARTSPLRHRLICHSAGQPRTPATGFRTARRIRGSFKRFGAEKADVPQGDTHWSASTTLRGSREPGAARRSVQTRLAGGMMGALGARASSVGSRFPGRRSRRLRVEPVVVCRLSDLSQVRRRR